MNQLVYFTSSMEKAPMDFVTCYQCTECNTTYSSRVPMNLCPADGRPVQMVLDVAKIKDAFPDFSWYRPAQKNMWRFGPLLPFDVASQKDKICSLNEGHTPFINIDDYPFCQENALSVFVKDEGQPYQGYGANPTGSFKDRGMSMVATMAKHYGLDKLAVPTQGNAGDSLTEYGVNFGLDVAVIMPDDTPMPIMGKVAAYAMQYPGISIELVQGTIREAGALMKEKYLNQGYFNCATFQEPGWRIEGKKTMGLELAEPWGEDKPEWELPDVIFYPTGGGTGILGMWKAFDELEELGVIGSKRPRIIAVQSEENAPVVDAFCQGLEDTIATQGGNTLATGINVPGGVGHKAVLKVLRESHGGGIKVSEQSIAQHCQAIFRQYGMWVCPEGAAAVAACEQALADGLVKTGNELFALIPAAQKSICPISGRCFYPDNGGIQKDNIQQCL